MSSLYTLHLWEIIQIRNILWSETIQDSQILCKKNKSWGLITHLDEKIYDSQILWLKISMSNSQILWLKTWSSWLALFRIHKCWLFESFQDYVEIVFWNVRELYVETLEQKFKKWAERAGDKIKGFEAQLLHLEITKNECWGSLSVCQSKSMMLYSQIDQEYYCDNSGCARTF